MAAPASIYDGMAVLILFGVALWFIAGPVCCGIVAFHKGREPIGWVFLGLIFGLFGLIAAAGVPTIDAEAEKARRGKPSQKQICPCCDEAISVAASVCPWCGCDGTADRP